MGKQQVIRTLRWRLHEMSDEQEIQAMGWEVHELSQQQEIHEMDDLAAEPATYQQQANNNNACMHNLDGVDGPSAQATYIK